MIYGCSNTPIQIESRALADQPAQSSERLIIAAVESDPEGPAGRAGSTPRGYDAIASYGPSPNARRLMRSLESEYGLREVTTWPIQPLHMHCAVLEIPEGADRGSLLAAMSHDQRVTLAQPMQTFTTRTAVYNDPYVALQHGFQVMDVADAHPWSRGDGVRVAIIDTGADTQHPDLRGSVIAAVNFVDSDELQFRRDRHGTEIAGVIAAVANNHEGIVGIAPGARLLVFKACWQARDDADAARCNSFTLARALVAAMDAHAQVVNLSLAGPADALLSDLIREGSRRGILFVGAAAAPQAPGNDDGFLHQSGVIEVAVSGARAQRDTALFAPGRDVLTLLPGGHYDFASGSSIATAHVTGVVALLLAKDHELSAATAYKLLRDTSAHLPSVAGVTDSVDACAAVVEVVGHGSCNPYVPVDSRLAGTEAH
jgi:subtilisin family serine protease